MKFITFTANPALDWHIDVDALKPGKMARASSESVFAGGKGVNVARILNRLGKQTCALYPGGGFSCVEHSSILTAEGVTHRIFPVPGALRRNVVIAAGKTGEAFKINSPGSSFPEGKEKELRNWILGLCEEGDWLILSGSLPPGLPDDFYASVLEESRRQDIITVLDSSGDALRKGAAAKPHIVKPNLSELSALSGKRFESLDEVERDPAVRGLIDGADILVSGGGEGAVLFAEADEGTWRGRCAITAPHLTVGGGDSLLGAFCAARAGGKPPGEALHHALAVASATAAAPPHRLASLQEVESIRQSCTVWQV